MLNDSENPQSREDWALLLPTVTQAINRQIIQSLGTSREALHFNTPTLFYPLAEISSEDNKMFSEAFDSTDPDVYSFMKRQRDKYVSSSRKAKVPSFYINQIVFAVDQTPSTSGTTSILKLPTKGPYRITSIDARNVTLEDLETGKIYTSHVELLRPLDIKDFKLLLSKKWDLNTQVDKAAKVPVTRSILDTTLQPVPLQLAQQQELEKVPEVEDEVDLENLFYPPPATITQTLPKVGIPTVTPPPRSPPEDIEDEFNLDNISFNSLHAEEDISKNYRCKLTKSQKTVTFIS